MSATKLSSPSTFFWKEVFPRVWTLGVGAGMAGIWLDAFGSPTTTGLKIGGAFMWLGTSFLIRLWSRDIRDVWLGDDALLVSDDGRIRAVSFQDIVRLSESRGKQTKTIRITLRPGSPLGPTIRFIPPLSFQPPFATHPSILKIQDGMRQLGEAERTAGTISG